MTETTADRQGWRAALPAAVRPYVEAGPLAAFFLGVSSALPFTLIAATLTGMALTSPEDRLVAVTGIALTVGVGCLIARLLRLGEVRDVVATLLRRGRG